MSAPAGESLLDAYALQRTAWLTDDEVGAFTGEWAITVAITPTVLDMCASSFLEFKGRFAIDGPTAPMTRAWLAQHTFLCGLLVERLSNEARLAPPAEPNS